jgi:predicted Co/Zn/Cd cation transporter (cation efflux family)
MTTPNPTDKAEQELLIKALVITLIGVAILLGAHFARAPSVQELLAGGRVVGWFALVLGLALLGRYGLRRLARGEPRR